MPNWLFWPSFALIMLALVTGAGGRTWPLIAFGLFVLINALMALRPKHEPSLGVAFFPLTTTKVMRILAAAALLLLLVMCDRPWGR